MKTYSVEIRVYDCHPETCCHWEHFTYWIVATKPLNGSSIYTTQEWIEGFNTEKEAEIALKGY